MTHPAPAPRKLHYRGYEMIVDDAERIAAASHGTLGQWSFAQILDHLARSFEASIDGIASQRSWPSRMLAGLCKGRYLNRTHSGGRPFMDGDPSKLAPDADCELEQALEGLRVAARRCDNQKQRGQHPLLGRLDRLSWDRYNLRHAELHMSFVVPDAENSSPDENATAFEPAQSHA
jgi:hypothetical protein